MIMIAEKASIQGVVISSRKESAVMNSFLQLRDIQGQVILQSSVPGVIVRDLVSRLLSGGGVVGW
jgi:hypothetical protein